MAVNKEKKFLDLFHNLSETEQISTLDFMEFLAERQHRNALERFYEELSETDEPLSKEMLEQLNSKEGLVTREEAKHEFNLDLP